MNSDENERARRALKKILEQGNLSGQTDQGFYVKFLINRLMSELQNGAPENSSYLKENDLTREMISATVLSYLLYGPLYCLLYEIPPAMQELTYDGYVGLFLHQLFLMNPEISGSVLVLGSGSGEDVERIVSHGHTVVANDVSPMMIQLLESRKLNLNVLVGSMLDVDIGKNKHKAVLIDTAIQHIEKNKVEGLLLKIKESLVSNGICLFRLRESENGQVFFVNDVIGKRYFNTYSRVEIEHILDVLRNLGFKIIKTLESGHAESKSGRPGFFTILVTNPAYQPE
jgi:hypothetical protein